MKGKQKRIISFVMVFLLSSLIFLGNAQIAHAYCDHTMVGQPTYREKVSYHETKVTMSAICSKCGYTSTVVKYETTSHNYYQASSHDMGNGYTQYVFVCSICGDYFINNVKN